MNSKDLTYSRERQVRKSNELIQKSRFNLSLQQQRILLFLISKIDYYDDEFKEYEFDIIDFCDVCGIDHTAGNNYRDIKAAIKGIRDKSLWITLDNGKSSLVSWIEKARIDEGKGIVEIRLDNDLKPYLLELKENYSQYQLVYTLRFRSKYSIRFYEWLVSIHYRDLESYTYTISVDDLKDRFGADTYKEYRDFKRRVLVPSVDEINQFSDKNVSFREIKHRRKVTSIEITVSSKDIIDRLEIRDAIDKALGFLPGQMKIGEI